VLQATIRYKDRGLRLASLEQLFIAIWSKAPTMEQMRALDQAILEHQKGLAGRKQVLISAVIDGGMPSFNDEVRSEAGAMARRNAAGRAAVAHVILLPGLQGLTVRTFTSTVNLLGRPSVPTKTFDKLESAAEWLLKYLDAGWTKERILSVWESVLNS
jgi:hypothetical protein